MTEKTKRFLEYANAIKNLGYKVVVCLPNEPYRIGNYGWVINDKDEIGYFQLSDWGYGVRFSTCHKPMHEFGCGFSLDDRFDYHTEFSRELIDRVFVTYPAWALTSSHCNRKYLKDIRKWSAKEYLEKHWDKENHVEI